MDPGNNDAMDCAWGAYILANYYELGYGTQKNLPEAERIRRAMMMSPAGQQVLFSVGNDGRGGAAGPYGWLSLQDPPAVKDRYRRVCDYNGHCTLVHLDDDDY